MRKRNKRNGPPTPLLVAAMGSDAGTIHFGPFGDIDEVIAWCERHGTQVSVIPLVDPSYDPWQIAGTA